MAGSLLATKAAPRRIRQRRRGHRHRQRISLAPVRQSGTNALDPASLPRPWHCTDEAVRCGHQDRPDEAHVPLASGAFDRHGPPRLNAAEVVRSSG